MSLVAEKIFEKIFFPSPLLAKPARLSQTGPLICPDNETYPGMAGVSCPGSFHWRFRGSRTVAGRSVVGSPFFPSHPAVSSIRPPEPPGSRHRLIVAAVEDIGRKIPSGSRDSSGHQARGKCVAGVDTGAGILGNGGASIHLGGSPNPPFFSFRSRMGRKARWCAGHRIGRRSAGRRVVPRSLADIASTTTFLGCGSNLQ